MKPEAISRYPAGTGRSPANLAFSALLFSFLGWAILERWSLGAGASVTSHLVTTLACAPVAACSLHRFRTACPRRMRASMRPRGVRNGSLALVLLFMVGAMFGLAASSGSLTLVLAPAALCCVAPWIRMRAHQPHLALSFLAVVAGSALAPALAQQQPSLMSALLAAWWLWSAAAMLCIALCFGELLERRGGR